MAKLTAKARKAIPTKEFAGPDRSYPIQNKSHARNALSRVSQYGTPELKKRVRAKVHAKYPEIGRPGGSKKDGESKAAHKDRMDRWAGGM